MSIPKTSLFILMLTCAVVSAQELRPVETPRRPITFEDMYKMGRVADAQPSPDGRFILYSITWFDLEKNSSNSEIYRVPVEGGNPKQLTVNQGYDGNARWSPDGKTIAYISTKEEGPQVWLMDADGSNQRRITSISTGASGVVWSPDGTHLLFSSSVFADCPDDACNKARNEKLEQAPKAMLADKLPYRVWNSWKEGKYSHVFIVPVAGGTPRDLTPGEFDTPPIDLGSSASDYVFSQDGSEIAYVKNTDTFIAASTNNDIWLVNADGSNARCITIENKGNDNTPTYSPDGRYIAYRSMARAGYEADKYDLKIYDRQTKRTWVLTDGFDRSVGEIIWRPDGKRILFTADDEAYNSLFEVPFEGGDILRVLKGVITMKYTANDSTVVFDLGTTRDNFSILKDNKTLVFTGQRMNYPKEVMTAVYDGAQVKDFRQVTNTNGELMKQLDMNMPESFTFKSFDGTPVQGWILNPPNFDPKKKYPMIFLVHGGPQGVWGDDFHYRWNAEVFASPGFVVVMINCRGSQGFGQAFTDGVNRSWGGAPYKDLMTGLDFVLKKYPYIDKDRLGAAGASYGGYMMNWFLGNTKRFKALFCHAGVFNLTSMYMSTEELWFPEWEFGGTPWTNPEEYKKWSPHELVKNFTTPTYVSHGQLDFRVPVEQGMQLFTALQKQGVESKFMYFPDEGHLVLKPKNAQLWYGEFERWFKKHLMK